MNHAPTAMAKSKMPSEILSIGGRNCRLFAADSPRALLLQPLGEHEQPTLEREVAQLAEHAPMPFALAAFDIADWNRELLPWQVPAIVKNAAVIGYETLHFLRNALLPEMKRRLGVLPVVLGGYSLAGLFALWAARECDAFAGVAAASPSVWIDGWEEYSASHPLRARQAFLSLGEREERARNQAIARVGERLRHEHARLRKQLGDDQCALEWNPGGHFNDCEKRLARAFRWNLDRLTETTA